MRSQPRKVALHGATRLAAGERFPNQAMRYGTNAYGVQFHAELTLAMLHRWTTHGHSRLSLPGAQARREHFRGRAIFDAPVKRWLGEFLGLIFGREVAGGDADDRGAAGSAPPPSASRRPEPFR